MTKRLKVKLVEQGPGQCGPAALAMVLGFYGVNKTLAELTKLTNCKPAQQRAGTSAQDLVKAARAVGLTGQVKDFATVADLRYHVAEKKQPVIISWFSHYDSHFSVVVRVTDEHIYFLDPEYKTPRRMTLRRFLKVWFEFQGGVARPTPQPKVRRIVVIGSKR